MRANATLHNIFIKFWVGLSLVMSRLEPASPFIYTWFWHMFHGAEKMFKVAVARPWTCSTYFLRQLPPRRLYSRFPNHHPERKARKNEEIHAAPVETTTPNASNDDRTLRQIFDSPSFWREFSQSANVTSDGRNVGLFQNRYLTSPRGFEEFANASLEKAKRIVNKVLAANSADDYHQVVRHLDRLSDLLCRVIDLSDFVRATHPDPEIQFAATRAHSVMYEYMNVLNTTTGLAKQLDIAMGDKTAPWGEQERMVAQILKRDFAKSAIDLPQYQRERFVTLSQEINDIGSSFVDTMAPEKEYLTFRSSQLKGMDPTLLRQFTQWGSVSLPTVGGAATAALRSVEDPEVRKEIYMANRTSSQATVRKLQALLKKRAELAKLSGYKSYTHMALEDKMAGEPWLVQRFLRGLHTENKRMLVPQSSELRELRTKSGPSDQPFQPWDKEYYMAQVLASVRSKIRAPDFLSSYFSLGVTMQGLSRLFSRLYGIRFVPHETLPGETWNSDVRRLDVMSDTEGLVAVLYCDLFSRPGKSPNPAHFTLRCSRFIRSDEINECRSISNTIFASAEEAANDGMAISKNPYVDGVMQLPTIALICDFATVEGSNKPALLNFNEVTTLFHEMGHAIHSILGRTDFQNVSGTRCATDFAELPSILMEHFAADQSVLRLFARHYQTDEPLPYEMVTEKLEFDKKFECFDVNNQIILSLLDQEVHSEEALDPSFNSTRIYHELQQQYSALPEDPAGTSWQGFFGHLFGYGGSYYSYLLDRVLARRVWQRVFSSGRDGYAINRLSGDKFHSKVLKWGGARDPWQMLSEALGDNRLSESTGPRSGPRAAMLLAGRWGIEGKKLEAEVGRQVPPLDWPTQLDWPIQSGRFDDTP
ncbi:hypothetical protein G7Y89_g5358 [Cudoniella acicularis]|uniref:Mitochondrial intermediate peptidase n=1 Tax=Cudoniella acicularis TaxID=354080 RepID=A0A8H4W3V6_9HELO|nr:hypothetical protein G7Y89_g5358 [Cudoniella acicularis]